MLLISYMFAVLLLLYNILFIYFRCSCALRLRKRYKRKALIIVSLLTTTVAKFRWKFYLRRVAQSLVTLWKWKATSDAPTPS